MTATFRTLPMGRPRSAKIASGALLAKLLRALENRVEHPAGVELTASEVKPEVMHVWWGTELLMELPLESWNNLVAVCAIRTMSATA